MDNDDMIASDALPATKGDLKAFATKADLEAFATKADLDAVAKKAEATFATKEDLLMFRGDLLREIALASARLEVRFDAREDRLLAAFADFRSEIVRLVEGSVSQSDLNHRGQILLGHRVDEIEKRVAALESKEDRPS